MAVIVEGLEGLAAGAQAIASSIKELAAAVAAGAGAPCLACQGRGRVAGNDLCEACEGTGWKRPRAPAQGTD